MISPLLDVNDLTITFKLGSKSLRVVDKISFTVNQSECVGIAGESGSGKSVTAKTILGLMSHPHVQVTGSVLYNGRNLLSMTEMEHCSVRGREISMIFQEPMTALNPVHSIFAQVAEPLVTHFPMRSRAEVEKRVFEVFRLVGLELGVEAHRLYPHELSGGMQQRVMIAMSIITEPKLLIADEPTTALDVTVQDQVLGLLRELQQRLGMSLLLISHDLAVISQMTKRLYVMYAGKVVEAGDTQVILKARSHPYTKGLLESIPDLVNPKLRLAAMPGNLPPPDELPSGCRFSDRCGLVVPHCSQSEPPLEIKASGQSVRCFEVH